MKHFTFKTAAVALLAIVAIAPTASAVKYTVGKESRIAKRQQTVLPGRQFDGKNIFSVDDPRIANSRYLPQGLRKTAVKDPETTYENLPSFGYLQGNDGNIWFYTSKHWMEEREFFVDEDLSYTEEVMVAFEFTIYDSTFKEVGKIKDDIDFAPNETRAVSVMPDPLITKNFFNTDDNLELMVYFAMNTEQFVNNYYYKVYSLGGEKDADGNSKEVARLDGRIVDISNAATNPGDEDLYFTFQSDAMPTIDDDGFDEDSGDWDYNEYIKFLNSMVYRHTVYTKATDDSGIKPIFSEDIYCANIPGDTTVGTYIITKPFGGKMYYIFSQYEKPYFVDPTGMAQDESATPDNSLIIKVLATDGGAPEEISFTKIPVPDYEVEGKLIYTYMSVGTVAWNDDIDMIVNGKPESPAFIVAVDVQNAAEYETYLNSGYYIYGADGKIIKTLAAQTDGMVLFRDGETEPEAMFTVLEGEGENAYYKFTFTGLYSGEEHFFINNNNKDAFGYDDPISASCDRVKQKDGSYRYAFEMTYYESDSEGNDYIRVAWFDDKGKQLRIDRINMGKDVMAGAVNMASSVLQPDLFDTDDAMEYAVMVKRSNGGGDDTTQGMATEFMIVDDNGNRYAHFTEEDGKGLPYSFTISFGEPNRLMMIYNNNYRYNIDVYVLPFLTESKPDESGVGSIISGDSESISFDGNIVNVAGATIEIYNTLGVRVAKGTGSVSAAALTPGTYVVVATDASGRKTSRKIAK